MDDDPSQYHSGEKWVQQRCGLERQADELEGMISDSLSGAMAFRLVSNQPMIVIATEAPSSDKLIQVDLVFGQPGFAQAHPSGKLIAFDPRKLRGSTAVNSAALPPALTTEGARIGLLALDAPNRRRFRINGVVEEVAEGPGGATVAVVKILQAFPNCPKYIHGWGVTIDDGHTTATTHHENRPESAVTSSLTAAAIDLLSEADMFFVGTRHAASGLDASHKGGPRGVVEVLGPNRVRFPDYVGNNMFCSLGNIHIDPSIGLAVVAWQQRKVVHIAGRATAKFDAPDPTNHSGGTGRFVEVDIDSCRISSFPATVHVTEGQRNPLIPVPVVQAPVTARDLPAAPNGGFASALKRFVHF